MNAPSCNPCKDSEALPSGVKDIRGRVFDRLTVLKHLGRPNRERPNRNHQWLCKCQCGAIVQADGASLRGGGKRSCGCLHRELARRAGDRTRTHGMSATSTHNVWDSMVQRCTNSNRKDFARYGGRGITVCERWLKFENFLADMGERPAGLSLERRRNDEGYSKGNCYWATVKQQNRNTSANRFLTHGGETLCVSAWAERLGMNDITLNARLRRGWSVERSLTTPVDMRFSRG